MPPMTLSPTVTTASESQPVAPVAPKRRRSIDSTRTWGCLFPSALLRRRRRRRDRPINAVNRPGASVGMFGGADQARVDSDTDDERPLGELVTIAGAPPAAAAAAVAGFGAVLGASAAAGGGLGVLEGHLPNPHASISAHDSAENAEHDSATSDAPLFSPLRFVPTHANVIALPSGGVTPPEPLSPKLRSPRLFMSASPPPGDVLLRRRVPAFERVYYEDKSDAAALVTQLRNLTTATVSAVLERNYRQAPDILTRALFAAMVARRRGAGNDDDHLIGHGQSGSTGDQAAAGTPSPPPELLHPLMDNGDRPPISPSWSSSFSSSPPLMSGNRITAGTGRTTESQRHAMAAAQRLLTHTVWAVTHEVFAKLQHSPSLPSMRAMLMRPRAAVPVLLLSCPPAVDELYADLVARAYEAVNIARAHKPAAGSSSRGQVPQQQQHQRGHDSVGDEWTDDPAWPVRARHPSVIDHQVAVKRRASRVSVATTVSWDAVLEAVPIPLLHKNSLDVVDDEDEDDDDDSYDDDGGNASRPQVRIESEPGTAGVTAPAKHTVRRSEIKDHSKETDWIHHPDPALLPSWFTDTTLAPGDRLAALLRREIASATMQLMRSIHAAGLAVPTPRSLYDFVLRAVRLFLYIDAADDGLCWTWTDAPGAGIDPATMEVINRRHPHEIMDCCCCTVLFSVAPGLVKESHPLESIAHGNTVIVEVVVPEQVYVVREAPSLSQSWSTMQSSMGAALVDSAVGGSREALHASTPVVDGYAYASTDDAMLMLPPPRQLPSRHSSSSASSSGSSSGSSLQGLHFTARRLPPPGLSLAIVDPVTSPSRQSAAASSLATLQTARSPDEALGPAVVPQYPNAAQAPLGVLPRAVRVPRKTAVTSNAVPAVAAGGSGDGGCVLSPASSGTCVSLMVSPGRVGGAEIVTGGEGGGASTTRHPEQTRLKKMLEHPAMPNVVSPAIV
ncbi:hypothetical protein BC828DRAFT_399031 [Blastocladiella britannica]|nr:hypothetical protein BC828DRAFT_399031 [Blastocladiella britannica]